MAAETLLAPSPDSPVDWSATESVPGPTELPTEFQDQMVQICVEHGVVGWIEAALFFDGQLDGPRLARAFRLTAEAEPVLACYFDDSVAPPVWRRRADLDRLTLCAFDDVAEIEAAVETRLADAPAIDEAPGLHGVLLRGREGRDALIVRINHAAADGTAALDVLYRLAAIYSRLAREPGYRADPNRTSRDSFLWLRSFKFRDLASVGGRGAIAALRRRGRAWGLVGDPARLRDRAQRGAPYTVLHRIDPAVVNAIEAAARARRCTLNEVLLAGFFRAYHEFLGAPRGLRMDLAMPINMRRYTPLEKQPAIRNLGGITRVSLGTELGPDFAVTLDRVTAELRRLRKGMMGVAEQWANPLLARLSYQTKRKLIGGAIAKGARRPAPPCVTNVGVARPERLDFGGLKPSRIGLATSPAPFPVFLMIALKYAGALTLSLGGYSDDLTRERAAAFLAKVETEMRSLTELASSARRASSQ